MVEHQLVQYTNVGILNFLSTFKLQAFYKITTLGPSKGGGSGIYTI